MTEQSFQTSCINVKYKRSLLMREDLSVKKKKEKIEKPALDSLQENLMKASYRNHTEGYEASLSRRNNASVY